MLASLRTQFSKNRTLLLNSIRLMNNEYVCVKEADGVRDIKMIDEKTRNALGFKMMQALREAINFQKDDTCLRAIVISAEGPVFSAGHNLKELHHSEGVHVHQQIFCLATSLMLDMMDHPVPIIAKINGLAAAAGCQLAAACDIAVCSDKSKFSTPGANFGVFCSTPGIPLTRTVHKATALYMLMTGDTISAKEALEAGLVSKVTVECNLDRQVCDIVDKIKMKSRYVISLGKQFYYTQRDLPIREAYEKGEEVMVCNVNSCDGREGIDSFMSKRKPVWSHTK